MELLDKDNRAIADDILAVIAFAATKGYSVRVMKTDECNYQFVKKADFAVDTELYGNKEVALYCFGVKIINV